MKNLAKRIAPTALALASLVGTAHAESENEFKLPDARLRFQYTGNADNNVLRTTLGLAPTGSYGDLPISTKGQFFETIRAYNVQESKNGETTNYTALGTRLPEFSLGEVKNNALLFGSFGDRRGIGIETRHGLDNLLITLNAEQNGQDQTRLGGALTYQINDSLSLTGAYDQVNGPTGVTRQYLGNGIADLSKTDAVGLVGVVKENADSTTDYSAGGFYIHYGANEQWGLRALGRLDVNPDKELTSFGGELIFAENPTTFRPGATWAVGRNVGSDDMYNVSVIPLSVSRTESVLLQNRATRGLSLSLRGNHTEIGNSKSSSVGGGVGYTFPTSVLGGKLGIGAEVDYRFSDDLNSGSVRPTIFYENGPVELEGGPIIPFGDGKEGIGAYIGVQIRF